MPMITVEGPRIKDVERKRKLVKKLTEVAMDVYNIEHITVIIRENLPENVGVNGQLVCDMKE